MTWTRTVTITEEFELSSAHGRPPWWWPLAVAFVIDVVAGLIVAVVVSTGGTWFPTEPYHGAVLEMVETPAPTPTP